MKKTMKLCVISDSHGWRYAHKVAKHLVKDADVYVDCGDTTFGQVEIKELQDQGWIMVRGNCDYYCDLPDKQYFKVNGLKFMVCHGNQNMYFINEYEEVDVVLSGHTHVYNFNDWQYEKTYINPGSISRPRDFDIPYGAGEFCVITVNEDKEIECERIIVSSRLEMEKLLKK